MFPPDAMPGPVQLQDTGLTVVDKGIVTVGLLQVMGDVTPIL